MADDFTTLSKLADEAGRASQKLRHAAHAFGKGYEHDGRVHLENARGELALALEHVNTAKDEILAREPRA